jgi:hypothetical protein
MPALRFPNHFPPTDRWKKFFIGVRWLGPDLSFFTDLKAIQAQRDAVEMEAWGGGLRQSVASDISRVLAQQLGWKSAYFLPEDSAAVAFHGPRFDFSDPESAFDAVLEILKTKYQISPPPSFWQQHGDSSMGVLISALLKSSEA